MEEKDFFWLVGLLEGEGCFMRPCPSAPNRPRISLGMTDEDIIKRAASYFGVSYHKRKSKIINHKDSYRFDKSGKPAVDWMKKLRPYMGERRQVQIDRAIAVYDPNYKKKRIQECNQKITPQKLMWAKKHPGLTITERAKRIGVTRWALGKRLREK